MKNQGFAEGRAYATASGHSEPSTMKKQHQRALRRSGERPFVLDSLRDTVLTRQGEAGCDARTLARIAGHASIAMSSRCVHPGEDAVMNVFARMLPAKELRRAVASRRVGTGGFTGRGGGF